MEITGTVQLRSETDWSRSPGAAARWPIRPAVSLPLASVELNANFAMNADLSPRLDLCDKGVVVGRDVQRKPAFGLAGWSFVAHLDGGAGIKSRSFAGPALVLHP
jgi:hypothetical protein